MRQVISSCFSLELKLLNKSPSFKKADDAAF